MKMTPVCRLDLGQTRVAGFTLFDPKSKEFRECTPKEVRQLILAGQVNGLKLCEDEIVLDMDGFNMRNLKIKSGVGNYRSMLPCEHGDGKFYAVVRLIDTDSGRLFEVVDYEGRLVKLNELKELPEKEDPVMGDSGRSVPEEKQVMDAEIEAAGMGEDKHSAAERKTNNKKVSSKTKAK